LPGVLVRERVAGHRHAGGGGEGARGGRGGWQWLFDRKFRFFIRLCRSRRDGREIEDWIRIFELRPRKIGIVFVVAGRVVASAVNVVRVVFVCRRLALTIVLILAPFGVTLFRQLSDFLQVDLPESGKTEVYLFDNFTVISLNVGVQ
jgi:hypothetical protein